MNTNSKSIIFSFYLILFCHFAVIFEVVAQDYDKSLLDQLSPNEPSSASLGRYGAFPIDYSTGLVPISIPIYEIKSGDLTQMIELSYHGGGIRVADESSWVGLGWDINFGGVITRNVNGFPDELEPYFSTPDAISMTNALKDNSDFSLVDGYYRPLADANVCSRSYKPDIYSCNFEKYSGTFLVKDAKPLFVKYNPIKGDVSENGMLLVTPEGNSYDFDGCEQTTLHSMSTFNRFFTYCSSYYISRIFSKNNSDSILYEFQDDGIFNSNVNSFNQGYKKTIYGGSCFYEEEFEFIPVTETTLYTQTVTSKKPHYIYFNEGRITFNLSSRSDLNPESSSLKKLDNILIEKKVGSNYQEVRRIVFMYSYFNENKDFNFKRLRLDSIVEWLPSDTHLLASFTYNDSIELPNKKAYSIDHWGYFNGKGGNSPIPITYYNDVAYGSADRSPDFEYAKVATIKSISYPTRGRTYFEWELNRVNSETPIYMKPEFVTLNLSAVDDPSLNCETITPIDGIAEATIHSYINQTLTIKYYLYQENSTNLTHNKYDKGQICVNDQVICNISNPTTELKESTIHLVAGSDNHIYIDANCNNVKGYIHLEYNSYNPAIDKNNYEFAGLRIKEINNYDQDGGLINGKRFSYLNESGKSSGFITNDRKLTYTKHNKFINAKFTFDGYVYCTRTTTVKTFNVYSTLVNGLEANNFCYEYVQEESVSNNVNNGLSKYQFSVCNDENISSDIPTISKNHLRGRLLCKTDYKRVGNTYKEIKEERNYYSKDPNVTDKKVGFQLVCDLDYVNADGIQLYNINESEPEYPGTFLFPYNYSYSSDWIHLDSTVTKDYFQSTLPVISKTVYKYGNFKHIQPTTIYTETSAEKMRCTHTKYSLDVESAISVEMSNRNLLTQPLDIKTFIKTSNSDSILTGGYYFDYSLDSYNHVNLTQVSKYLPDNTLDLLNTYSYNQRGRLIEAVGRDNLSTSIYWGSDGYHPLVIGKNITYSNLMTALSGVTDLSTLYQKPACSNAQITTYSFKPLLGIGSKTDSRGLKTFFNYDNMGRCTSILDNESMILNAFQYHFIGQ